MYYIVISCAVCVVCLLVGWLLVNLVAQKSGRPWGLGSRLVLSASCAIVLMGAVLAAYLGVYYHAEVSVASALEGDDTVSVTRLDEGYRFDGPGTQAALVFFPGAKVQTEAYAPLMRRLASQGVDCYLVDPPAYFALFGMRQAQTLLDSGSYPVSLVGGHSLGGVAATSLAGTNVSSVRGVVLLASYPTKPLASELSLLSLYGSEDGCLNVEEYGRARQTWPPQSSEGVIEGGNHAGFAAYGPQRGDGEATISSATQQELAAQAIAAFARSLGANDVSVEDSVN